MRPGAVAVDEIGPADAYRTLEADAGSCLIDVRTRAEWSFVGLPDLSALGKRVVPVEWIAFPSMMQNARFADELRERLAEGGGAMPTHLLFICRSGQRSLAAAQYVASTFGRDSGLNRCTNVAEGFEGSLDAEGHRGRENGWKVRGLPWRQS